MQTRLEDQGKLERLRHEQLERQKEDKRMLVVKTEQTEVEKERRLELRIKADQLRRRLLMKNFGLDPWKKMMNDARLASIIAAQLHRTSLKKKVFRALKKNWLQSLEAKEVRAVTFWQNRIKSSIMAAWTKVLQDSRQRKQTAEDFYDIKTLFNAFHAWRDHVTARVVVKKNLLADEFYMRTLKETYFKNWKEFKTRSKLIEQRDKRCSRIVHKITQILPDYRSNEWSDKDLSDNDDADSIQHCWPKLMTTTGTSFHRRYQSSFMSSLTTSVHDDKSFE